jgi:hypothetical protein
MKAHPLLAELAGMLLHEVNNSAQFLSAVDALATHLGPAAVEGREADLHECAQQLALHAQALAVLTGGESRADLPICDALCALVRKRLQRERRELRCTRTGEVSDAEALSAVQTALTEVRAAAEGTQWRLHLGPNGLSELTRAADGVHA